MCLCIIFVNVNVCSFMFGYILSFLMGGAKVQNGHFAVTLFFCFTHSFCIFLSVYLWKCTAFTFLSIFIEFIGMNWRSKTKLSLSSCEVRGWQHFFERTILVRKSKQRPQIGPFIITCWDIFDRPLLSGHSMRATSTIQAFVIHRHRKVCLFCELVAHS